MFVFLCAYIEKNLLLETNQNVTIKVIPEPKYL